MIVNVFVVAMRSYVVGTRSALEQRASREVITLAEAYDSPIMTFDIATRLESKPAHTLLQERLANNEDKEVSAHTNAQVLGTVMARFNSQQRVFFALHGIESRSEAQGKVYAFHHDRSFSRRLPKKAMKYIKKRGSLICTTLTSPSRATVERYSSSGLIWFGPTQCCMETSVERLRVALLPGLSFVGADMPMQQQKHQNQLVVRSRAGRGYCEWMMK